MIDLRSDTVTRPTPEMKAFMLNADVGDDVFGEDPSVNELQTYIADLFGMEAALFCPSGTMANQIAIKAQTLPGDEVICEAGAHVHYYEAGGISFNSGASVRPVVGKRGVFSAEQIESELRPANIHFPRTSLVCAENTCNRGGGKIFSIDELKRISSVCDDHGLAFHLDGARVFNAIVAENRNPRDLGQLFNSISVCLSKGLGAPLGSVLLGDRNLIGKALRIRKVFGGGMRQAGFMAAAGLYALKHNVRRLADDHMLAKDIETVLKQLPYVDSVLPVETNIVVFNLDERIDTALFLNYLKDNQVLAFAVGEHSIRFVTHLDVHQDSLSKIGQVLKRFS